MKIVFVCTGNTCRSPMAEAIYNHISREKGLKNTAISRGTNVFMPQKTNTKSILALEKYNIYNFAHTAQQLTEEDIIEADLVLTMTASQKMAIRASLDKYKDKVFTLCDKAYGKEADISDPFGGTQEDYNKCLEIIAGAVEKILCSE